MLLYLPAFLIAFGISVGTILLFVLIPYFTQSAGAGKRSETRHAGKEHLSRLGGIGLIFGFGLAVLLDPHLVLTKEILGLLVCSLLILLFGLWDDFREQDWQIQLFFQISLCIIIFLFGVKILSVTNPLGGAWSLEAPMLLLPGFLILSAWILLVLNAVNWLDGLDGLLGGVSLFAFFSIFVLSLKPFVNQPPIAILAAAGLGSVLGFLIFNFHPAKILAGTSGALFLGFLVAVLAVLSGTKIATALLVLALPIADSLFVIWKRFRARASVFLPDTRHLHYRLRDLGWSETRIALFFYTATAAISLIALHTMLLGKLAAILIVLGSVFAFLSYVEWENGYCQVVCINTGELSCFLASDFFLSALLLLSLFLAAPPEKLIVGHEAFTLETARTPEERMRGLSGRDSLCPTCAMLF
ncbi:MAG: hypothetical protein WDN67_01460 [Candidatus Moraniibacteriota bacterium]